MGWRKDKYYFNDILTALKYICSNYFFCFSCFCKGVLHTARPRCTARPRFWAASSAIQAQVSVLIQASSAIQAHFSSFTALHMIFRSQFVYLQAFWAVYLLFTQGKTAGLGEFLDLTRIVFVLWWCVKACLVFSIEDLGRLVRGDEACSQVFVNQLSALPCQTPHCSYSTSASIIILNFLGEFVVSGPKAVKVTNKSWHRTLFSPLNADLSWNKHSMAPIQNCQVLV